MIKVENVSYSVKNKNILSEVHLALAKGSFTALIGPNGAGKSTLLKIILNIISHYSGEIYIENERNITWLSKNLIGYLPQHELYDAQFPISARELVLMGITGKKGILKHFNKEDKEKADYYLNATGVFGKSSQQIGLLSGGELQRVLLARALITESEYLLLDEPEASIDYEGISSFFELLASLHENVKKTILISTHEVQLLPNYCDDIYYVNRKIRAFSKEELSQNYQFKIENSRDKQ